MDGYSKMMKKKKRRRSEWSKNWRKKLMMMMIMMLRSSTLMRNADPLNRTTTQIRHKQNRVQGNGIAPTPYDHEQEAKAATVGTITKVKGLTQQMFDRANTEHSNLKRLSKKRVYDGRSSSESLVKGDRRKYEIEDDVRIYSGGF
ncbi:hypothetical protein Tco_0464121 [Tanacetum coccineum]